MVSDEQKRWLVTIYALNCVVGPHLKLVVKEGMDELYKFLDDKLNGLSCALRSLTYDVVHSSPPRDFLQDLNFVNINGNFYRKDESSYKYNVRKIEDLAKLYLPTDVPAKFSKFDNNMDVAVAIKLLGYEYPKEIFSSEIQSSANDVRKNVRNECDHFREREWTESFFNKCFDKLRRLVVCLLLAEAEKKDIEEELSKWQVEGFKMIVDEEFKEKKDECVKDELAEFYTKLDTNLQTLLSDVNPNYHDQQEEMRKKQWELQRDKYPIIRPDEVDIKAKEQPFCIRLEGSLKEETVTARFEGLRDVNLKKVADNEFYGQELPKPATAGFFKIKIESRNGDFLGKTEIWYKGSKEEDVHSIRKKTLEIVKATQSGESC